MNMIWSKKDPTQLIVQCNNCHGKGMIPGSHTDKQLCPACNGYGLVKIRENSIPLRD